MDHAGRVWRAIVVAVPLVFLSGCAQGSTQDPATISPGLEAIFDAELAGDLSDYSRGVLEDKVVSGVEYQDAESRYVECVNEAFPGIVPPPFAVVVQPDGALGHTFTGTKAQGQQFDIIEPGCLHHYQGDGAIPMLYWAQIDNPEATPLDQQILDCLVGKGLVDPDIYGVDEVDADMAQSFDIPDTDRSAATGLDFTTGEAFDCYAFQN